MRHHAPIALRSGPCRKEASRTRQGNRPKLPPARRETLASPDIMVGFARIVAGARRQ